jgi:hypothetical protein
MYISQERINEEIEKAKHKSVIGGLIKYLYYISPLGYLFNYEKHKLCRDVTVQVWQKS